MCVFIYICVCTIKRLAAARHDDVYRQTTTVCRSTAAARAPGLNKVYYYSHTRTRARAAHARRRRTVTKRREKKTRRTGRGGGGGPYYTIYDIVVLHTITIIILRATGKKCARAGTLFSHFFLALFYSLSFPLTLFPSVSLFLRRCNVRTHTQARDDDGARVQRSKRAAAAAFLSASHTNTP